MAEVLEKTAMERRIFAWNMAAKVSPGATGTAVQLFISRASPPLGLFPLQATTLFAAVTAGATTIQLTDDPRAGALLILEPGTSLEETVKVSAVSGASAPFTATIHPEAFYSHLISTAVSYEFGESARMLINAAPTPSGSTFQCEIENGCYLQAYRCSAHLTCNDGQRPEEEFTLLLIDPIPSEQNTKQPSETVFLAAEMDSLMEGAQQSGATVVSGVAYASFTTPISPTPTLAAQATRGATTISLTSTINPGIGAALVLSPTGSGANPVERVYATNVTGTGPYTVTISPSLEFTHANGSNVTTYMGINTNFLVSTNSTITGKTLKNMSRRGPSGRQVTMVWLATTTQLERLQHSGIAIITET